MKRQTQQTGVRYWNGNSLIELQSEPFKALDGFFAEYGPCVATGCKVSKSGSVFNVSSGLVVLTGQNHEEKEVTMIAPFAGADRVSLPLFLTLQYTPKEELYADGHVKPVAYEYNAQSSTVAPEAGTPHLKITETDTVRFVDAIQDKDHRFITDIERSVWNAKETPSGAQTKANEAQAAAISSAKSYADSQDTITLQQAKDFAATVAANIVGGSPEMLDTLVELARAIGNDPNFAATMATELGKRATTQALSEGLASKADRVSSFIESKGAFNLENLDVFENRTSGSYKVIVPGVATHQLSVFKNDGSASALEIFNNYTATQLYFRTVIDANRYSAWREIYHSGNFNPESRMPLLENATVDVNQVVNGAGKLFNASNVPYIYYPFLSFGGGNYKAQLNAVNNNLAFRSSNDANGDLHPWVNIWHSGNSMPCVWAGKIDTWNSFTPAFGDLISSISTSYNTDRYILTVNLRQTGRYSVSATPTGVDDLVGVSCKTENISQFTVSVKYTGPGRPQTHWVNIQIFRAG